jgi:MFS family permease
MISPVPNQAARIIKPFTGLFYGWRMVAAASAVRVLGAGLHSYGFTVFFLPRSQELNPSRTATSFAFSLSRAEGAIEGPIVGHLLDRYSPRPVMLAAVLLMGGGYEPMLWILVGMFFISGIFYSLLGRPWAQPKPA